MKFEVVATESFQEQFNKLPEKYQRQIKAKIELIEQNPFRFKAIHSRLYSRVFRVRLGIEGTETRLIYVVIGSKIIIACLLDRTDEYRDLEKYLKRLGVQIF